MNGARSHRRIFVIAVALGFVGGFSVVAVAGSNVFTARQGYTAAD